MMAEEKIKVWDIGVRLFHWSLVILFFVSYVTGEEESLLHIYAGYGVAGLIVFRVVWGFVGTQHTRFSDFVYGPKAVFRYVGSLFTAEPAHYLGHNPLGGWMVIALLIALFGVSWSGLELYGAEGHGPLANQPHFFLRQALANGDEREHDEEHEVGEKGEEKDEFWEEIHEVLANLTLFLVFIHIAGVLVASVKHRENLIRAMITGYKRASKT